LVQGEFENESTFIPAKEVPLFSVGRLAFRQKSELGETATIAGRSPFDDSLRLCTELKGLLFLDTFSPV
jgi:hypothetical protein